VTLSVTSLDRELQRRMEPRTSVPHRRLHAIETLAKAGVPVGVNVAPVIPGLNDEEIPAILKAAADAGASSAAFLLVRLPLGVADHFTSWLERHYPDRKDKIMHRIRGVRDGRLNDARFFTRTRGIGPYAEGIRTLFRVSAKKAGLDRPAPVLSTASFRRDGGVQADLFL
jgi:DNA repair photolyase